MSNIAEILLSILTGWVIGLTIGVFLARLIASRGDKHE